MKKTLKIIDNLDGYLAAAGLSITIILLSLQVFNRYVLGISLSWTEELSRFTYVWCVYLGVSMAVRSGEHVRIVAHLKALFPYKIYSKIILFADLVWLLFSIVMLVVSIKFLYSMSNYKFLSPALGISMFWVYLIIPLAFIMMIIRLVQVNFLKHKFGASDYEEENYESAL